MDYVKYPSTPHITRSQTINKDDIVGSIDHLLNTDVVITEKMDGEATTMYNDHIHARSIDSNNHPSRNFVKNMWGELSYKIPKHIRICGENMYAQHSIYYENLDSYFLVYNTWENNICLDIEETVGMCNSLGLTHVPILYRGVLTMRILSDIINSLDTDKQEGIVIRNAGSFKYEDFDENVFKWVRKNHVQTDEHWTRQEIVPNKLKEKR